jgi:hypothetical protein
LEGVDVLGGVGRGDLDAEAGVAFGDDGVAEADDEDAQFEEALAHGDRLGGVVDDDGADGGGGFEDVEAGGLDLLAGVGDVVLEAGDALGLAHQDLDGLVGAAGDGDGEGVGEERGAAALDEEFDDALAGGDEAAGAAAEGLAEGAGEDVDAAGGARSRPVGCA